MKVEKSKVELLMAQNCITAKELRKKSEIPTGTYIKLMSGNSARPCTVGKLAKALGCNVSDIVKEGPAA